MGEETGTQSREVQRNTEWTTEMKIKLMEKNEKKVEDS